MALLVLFSTISFTVEKHYCGNTLVDVSVFSEPNKCGMESMKDTKTVVKKSCCKDIIDIVQGQDELQKVVFEDLDFKQQLILTSYLYSYINPFEGLPQNVIPNKDYSPPNLVTDILLLDQIFLI